MSSAKALKKKIAKRAKQKKNIQVKNSIRLKHKASAEGETTAPVDPATEVVATEAETAAPETAAPATTVAAS